MNILQKTQNFHLTEHCRRIRLIFSGNCGDPEKGRLMMTTLMIFEATVGARSDRREL